MSKWINASHFSDLEVCSPDDVVERTGCGWDPENRRYTVSVWGYDYFVDMDQAEILPGPGSPEAFQEYLYLFIIFYLIKARKKDLKCSWVSEKDLTGGAAFFRGPHLIPVNEITACVGNDLERFEAICTRQGGRAMEMADRAFCFEITPLIPVAVLYWQGDEDFGCEAKMLFDPTIEDQLPLDIVYALAVEVCKRLVSQNA